MRITFKALLMCEELYQRVRPGGEPGESHETLKQLCLESSMLFTSQALALIEHDGSNVRMSHCVIRVD